MLVRDLIEGPAASYGDRVAVVCGPEQVTYSTLNRRSNAVAAELVRAGINGGDRVALLMGNSPEFLYAYLAIAKLGAIAVPLNTHLAPPEIAFMLEHSRAAGVIYSPATRDLLPPPGGGPKRFITAAGTNAEVDLGPILAAADAPDPGLEIDPDSPMAIFYTSGSTGDPKGVVLTHRNIATCAEITVRGLNVTADEIGFMVIPMYHTSLHMMAFPLFLAGGRLVVHEGFKPAETIALIAEHGASTYVCVTSTAVLTLKAAQEMGGAPLRSLRKLLVGGSPIPPAMIAAWKALAPEIDIYAIYGLTEMSPSAARLHGDDVLRKPGSVGRPYDGIELKVVDDVGIDVPTGSHGEICLRSPTRMKEYYRNPVATAAAVVDGWLHTGDIGYVDDEGYLYIVDRKKNVIKRGGVTIYPAEIEAVLYQHPAVKEVLIIGLTDPIMGEIVTAVIALRPGVDLSAADLVAHCRTQLAGFKAPEFVVFVDELKKSSTGKVWIRGIRDSLEADRSQVIDCRPTRTASTTSTTAGGGTSP